LPNEKVPVSRRDFAKLACAVAVGGALTGVGNAQSEPGKAVSLFDGKTLDGWIQIENNATAFAAAQITDPTGFFVQLAGGQDAVSAYLRGRLDDPVKASLATYSATSADAKAAMAALIKDLNQIVTGATVYDPARFSKTTLRPETAQLLAQNPQGYRLARLNKLLLEDAYPTLLAKSPGTGWVVQDGAMTSTGSGRGVIYTEKDYSRYRLIFSVRHLYGKPDHQACVLIFCTRPQGDSSPIDALAGVQFEMANGYRWDYRPGKNNDGGQEFTLVNKAPSDPHAWSRFELLVDATAGTARMAMAQPLGSKAVEVLDFKDPTAGKVGPIAWQVHNPGLIDQFKDVTIEVDPKDND
jgi:hypothetical protein